ncbi:MAG TPA: acyl-CoA dehydrogenase family protein [Thermoleophilaceae bacterium]|nr:acyl-CoA dehydrogenase family protein [Thermoleophilaceae bacterium]
MSAALIDAAAAAEASADQTERERRLAPEVVEALRAGDLFRLCVPRGLGGAEASPRTLVEAVEALGRADASAGWCLAVTATSGLAAAYMDEDAAREVYGTEGVAVGGVFAPRGRAVGTGDELTVTGRWPFASGSDFCDWLMGGCLTELDGAAPEPRLVLFPREDVETVDTWTVSGLCGTGSHDIAVRDLRVPVARSAAVIGAAPRDRGALYAFPLFGLLAAAIAGVTLGVARGAMDDIMALAGVKTPEGGRRRLAERQTVQAEVARAEAALRAGRALVVDALERAYAVAEQGAGIGDDLRLSVRLAATHATRTARGVVDACYELGGGSSIYTSSPLQRRFRDVHAATQHMLVAPATWELTGRLLLDLPTDTSQL